MKKKHRDITVGGIKYAWTIHNNCDGDGGNCVKIWKDKKILIDELIRGDIDITPKFISEIIKVYVNSKYQSEQYKLNGVRQWINTLSYTYVVEIKGYIDATQIMKECPDFFQLDWLTRRKMAIEYARKHMDSITDIECIKIID